MSAENILFLYILLISCFMVFLTITIFYVFNNKVLSKINLSLKICVYLSILSILLIVGEYYLIDFLQSQFLFDYIYLVLIGLFLIYIFLSFIVIYINLRPIKKIEQNTFNLSLGENINLDVAGSKEFENIQENLLEIENANISNEEYKVKLKKEYYKFVPREFYDYLGKSEVFELTLGENVQKDVTVLFIDIRSSHKTSETLSLDDNFKFINNYLSIVGECVRKNKGFIDKFLGDGVLAVFLNEDDALKCSTQIANNFENINLVSVGTEKIRYGIGIHCGKVVIGIVGEKERLTPTIISDSVNLAKKIESLNKIFLSNILFTKEVLNNLDKNTELNYRYVGTVSIDNIGVSLFENLDAYQGSNKTDFIKTKNLFETAVRNFEEKNHKNARKLFIEVLKINESDNLAKYYLKKCKLS